MIKYNLRESQDGSLFIVTSKKENLYGLYFNNKDIEVQDFDDDFLQERMVELLLVKFTKNESTHIKYVVETCYEIFTEVSTGKFQDKVLYLSVDANSCRSSLIDKLVLQEADPNLVYLRVRNIHGQTFYFVFNENHTSTMSVMNGLLSYFKKEYEIDLTWNAKKEE